jgi:hypothetical protein
MEVKGHKLAPQHWAGVMKIYKSSHIRCQRQQIMKYWIKMTCCKELVMAPQQRPVHTFSAQS